jgi:tRNA(fMet)-specific endonuclease VapC
MLDTNVCIGLLRGGKRSASGRVPRRHPDELCLSSITLAELCYGASKSSDIAGNERAIIELCVALEVVSYGDIAAETYGRVRANLESSGRQIGPLDTLIAAHALSLDVALITNNEREFERVPGLRVETWSPI